ncbi:PAS domain-containing protein [Pedomonas mirosovicensis]|uniref:PAS domain-containing protein n=1 Tax=Pedomonas mirosovicensis TaxID=2908641 RepID=UPI0021695A6E|nr:PAS domain-containing protein [Pedomonas mirosovicensis]MCH8686565.1 PAS domain-containing protein [Pedomonas mirosovicensis]
MTRDADSLATEVADRRIKALERENAQLRALLAAQAAQSSGAQASALQGWHESAAMADANTGVAEAITFRRLRHLVDSLPFLIAYIDADLRYRYINATYERWFGQPREKIIGQTVEDLLGTPHFMARREQLEAALRGEYQRFTLITPTARGLTSDLELEYLPCRNAKGAVEGLYVLAIDVSDRKRAERALLNSEIRQHAITEATPDCIKLVSADGRLLHMNPAGLSMLEAPDLDSVRGTDILDAIAPEWREEWHRKHNRVIAGERLSWQFEILSLTGNRRFMETHAVPLQMPDGTVAHLAVTRDISQQRQAEAKLQDQSRILETVNRTGKALAAELDLERVVQMVTDAGVELTGAQLGAFFYHVLDDKGSKCMLFTLSGADPETFKEMGIPRNTHVLSPTFNGEAVVRSHDITRDPRFGRNAPHQGMPEGHLPVRSYLAVPVISRSGEVLGGLFFGHPEPGRFTEQHEQLMVAIASQASVALDNARLYQAAQRELAERRRVEEALRSSEAALRKLNRELEQRVSERTAELDNMWRLSQDVFLVITPKGIIRAINPAVTRLLGYKPEDMVGRSFRPYVHPDDLGRSLELLAIAAITRPESDLEVRLRAADGTWRWFAWTAGPGEGLIYAVGRDITGEKAREAELAQMQETLRQSQKLEAIGQLTGGVAHDFNNLLTVIRSSADLLQRQNLTEDRRKRYIDAIAETADRAAKLTSQLLAFSRRQALRPEVFEVGERLSRITEMLHSAVGERVTVITNPGPGNCHVEADATQFETAIINMAANARDAMNGEGTITITVAPRQSVPNPNLCPPLEGPCVALSIADTGCGIAPEHLGRIFEPFFTTKEVGKGTGLGLSQVYGFAKQSGGELDVESEPGKGTTFTVYLPRIEKRDEAEAPDQSPRRHQMLARPYRVLLVEDDIQVGEFARLILTDLGYRSEWMLDPQSALELLEQQREQFDIVLSDVVMPGMNGIEFAQLLQSRYPDLPVVLTSGYSQVLVEEGNLGFELLKKPYTSERLTEVLSKALSK